MRTRFGSLMAAGVVISTIATSTVTHAVGSEQAAELSGDPIKLTFVPNSDARNGNEDTDIPQSLRPTITARKKIKGGYLIEGTGSYQAGAPCYNYEYKIDLKRFTYTLSPVAQELDDRYLKPQGVNLGTNPESDGALDAAYRDVSAEPAPGRTCNQQKSATVPNNKAGATLAAITPGYWWARVAVRTRDLPDWTITKTTDYLEWTSYSNGTVAWNYWQVNWYGVNPSPLNTHWYILQQNHYGPTYGSGNTSVYKGVYGAYYNYDWGFSNWATYAYQNAGVTGLNNATFNYSWSHNDSGEDSGFIWGVVTLN